MKTVSWLDETAPGFARGFLKYLYLLAGLFLVTRLLNPHSNTGLIGSPSGLAIASLWVVFWTLCLWQLPNKAARFCLGASSAILCGYFVFILVAMLLSSATHLLGLIVGPVVMALPLAGFGSMLWVALHPPSQPFGAWKDKRVSFRNAPLASS
jgi:hypothetical protein